MCGKPVDGRAWDSILFRRAGITGLTPRPGQQQRTLTLLPSVSTLSIVTTCMCNTGVHYIVRCRSGSGEGETKIQDHMNSKPISVDRASSLSRECVWARFVIKIRSIDGENYRFRTFAHPKFSSKLNRMLK